MELILNQYIFRLGETCSHVAAIISAVIQACEIRDESGQNASTSQKCAWLPAPSHTVNISL